MDLCLDMDSPLHLFYRLCQTLSAEQTSVGAFLAIMVDIFRVRMRPLQNAPFCPIPVSGLNFNPRNTKCIPACPVKCEAYFSGVVKIFTFLELEQNSAFCKDLRVSVPERPEAEKFEIDSPIPKQNEQLDIGLPGCKT